MSGQAFYLKYRPTTFEDLVGQEPITRTLRNALQEHRVRHAYLFTGPRGTGKTTTARLLAKAVNCLAPEPQRPCNRCALCTAINEGRLMDLIEIDAASNRGIDEIRDLRDKVSFRPSQAQFKVYVLDEAHMLTGEAFNALLKTLEEPPPHVIFILVTTDPHKIPATIASRCQRFDFRRVPLGTVADRLAFIAEQEGLRVERAALELIARQGGGALRDAVSLLDQVASYGGEVHLDQVQMVLGSVASEAAGQLAACLARGDTAGGLDVINRTVGDGADPRQLGREVVEYLRGVLLVQHGTGTRLLNATAEQAAEIEALARTTSVERVLRGIRLFNEATLGLRRGVETLPQLPLEMALVECLLGEAPPPASAQPDARAEAPRPAQPLPPEPAPRHTPEPAARAPETAAPEPAAAAVEPSGQPLSLEQVQQAWGKLLEAVRQRNRTTQAVLASGCKPVELTGNQLTVTIPSPILGDKLKDPQRTLEVEEALLQVLNARCRLKWVLADDYRPAHAASAAQPAQPEGGPPQPGGDAIPPEISRWAQDRGGQARIVRP